MFDWSTTVLSMFDWLMDVFVFLLYQGLEAIKQFVKADTESSTPALENRDGPT